MTAPTRGRPRVYASSAKRIYTRCPAGLVEALVSASVGYERRPDTVRRLLDIGLAHAKLHGLMGLEVAAYVGDPVAVGVTLPPEIIEQIDELARAVPMGVSRSRALALLLAAGVGQPASAR